MGEKASKLSALEKLIVEAKQVGSVRYADIAKALVEDQAETSTEAIDDLLMALTEEGILLVSERVRVVPIVFSESEEDDGTEKNLRKKPEVGADESLADTLKTNDPVRMYLRKMGSVSLLTREGKSKSPSESRKVSRNS